MENTELNFSIGMLLLRMTGGMLFFFQGYDKVYKVGVKQVVETFNDPFQKTPLPQFMLKPMVLVSSYLEMICGLLLVLGLFRDVALYLLAADLAAVALMFSAMKAMWDMQFFFPRFIMVLLLLLLPSGTDRFCLDKLLG
jgi:putative oxidoreductase